MLVKFNSLCKITFIVNNWNPKFPTDVGKPPIKFRVCIVYDFLIVIVSLPTLDGWRRLYAVCDQEMWVALFDPKVEGITDASLSIGKLSSGQCQNLLS